ncbi:MAG: TIGR00282 family metallophosphoesterase [Synergistaceae bacterium]|nr:TIGR00282 family metallophosphoesterase [Synergistaceae bacterium]
MKILFSGDVAWDIGRRVFAAALPELRQEWGGFDFVIINCENAASNGRGMTEKIYKEFMDLGVDGMTSGNHIWDKNAFYPVLDAEFNVFRPANYHASCPGRGCGVITGKHGKQLGILNLEGQVFMPPIDSPFDCADKLLEELKAKYGENLPVLVDFHAEATSEKKAIGYYLDGRVSAVLGTHTHVQTSDEQILPKGTAFMTDVGMTGGHGGAIGVKIESVMPRFLTGMPVRFEMCVDNPAFNGAVIETDDNTGLAVKITRILKPVQLED